MYNILLVLISNEPYPDVNQKNGKQKTSNMFETPSLRLLVYHGKS